jgi:hypothetical protein
LSALTTKGEVKDTVRVEEDNNTRELVGVHDTVNAAAVMTAVAEPC